MFGVSGARAQGRRPESKLGVFGAQHKLKNSQNLTSVGRQWELERGRFGGFRKPEKATQAGRAVILKPSFVALIERQLKALEPRVSSAIVVRAEGWRSAPQ